MNHQFITIEGIEGVGKSTICQTIYQHLRGKNFPVLLTREPGGTPIGEAVRQVILNDYAHTMAPMCELLLMFSARAQHIEQIIRPALAQNEWVLSDRFTDASFAYQGSGRGIDFEKIALLENLVQNDLQPGLTLLLDAPVDVAFERMIARGNRDRIEQESHEFFERIRQGYLTRAKTNPTRYQIIDAQQALEKVQADVVGALESYLSQVK